MRGKLLFQVILGVALAVAIIGLGAGVYQAGYLAGAATQGGVAVVPPVGYGYGWGWHGGFGLFGFLGFFLFLFLLFGLFRAIAWGGRSGRGWPAGFGHGGPGGAGFGHNHDGESSDRWQGAGRGWFDEWHRRAHESGSGGDPEASRGPNAAGADAR